MAVDIQRGWGKAFVTLAPKGRWERAKQLVSERSLQHLRGPMPGPHSACFGTEGWSRLEERADCQVSANLWPHHDPHLVCHSAGP